MTKPTPNARARILKATLQRAGRDERAAVRASRKSTRDSFQNFPLNLGMGTGNALSASTYGFNPITRIHTLLEWMHRGSWLAGVAVDVVADDMTRSGIEVQTVLPPKDLERLARCQVRLGIWAGTNSINSGIKWGRLYGGCIAVMLVDGQRMETPLNVDRIGKGQFRGLLVLDRWMVEPDLSRLVPELGPDLGKPMFYRVTADAPALPRMTVHYSRVMRFEGIGLPYWQRVQENLWGESVLERLYDRMVAFDSASTGAAQTLYKSHLRTIKVAGLRDLLAEGGNTAGGNVSSASVLAGYVRQMAQFQGIEGVTLIDGEDEFAVQSTSGLTGMADALLQFGQQVSGALGVPLTRLFGQSPAGLNSTGESDLRTYYDGINQSQERDLRIPVERILRLCGRSEGVALPDDLQFVFRPLWQLTEDQKSQVADRDASSIANLEERGILPLPVALKELRQGSRVTGRFSNITDEMIAEAEAAAPDITELIAQQEEDRALAKASGEGPDNPPEPPEGGGSKGGKSSLEPKEPTGPKDRAAVALAIRERAGQTVQQDSALLVRLYQAAEVGEHQTASEDLPSGHRVFLSLGTAQGRTTSTRKHLRKEWRIKAPGEQYSKRVSEEQVRALVRDARPSQDSLLPRSSVLGFQVVVEARACEQRWPGSPVLMADYGYVRRVPSAEGAEEWMDAFMGDGERCYVIDQFKPDGLFDEHKLVLGASSASEAGWWWDRFYLSLGNVTRGDVVAVHPDVLRLWLERGDVTRPFADQRKLRLVS